MKKLLMLSFSFVCMLLTGCSKEITGIYHNENWNGKEAALVLKDDFTCVYPGGDSNCKYEIFSNEIAIWLDGEFKHSAYIVDEGIILHGHYFEKK